MLDGFRPDLAAETLNRVCLQLNDGGYVLFGSDEVVADLGEGFKPCAEAGQLYRLASSEEHAA